MRGSVKGLIKLLMALIGSYRLLKALKRLLRTSRLLKGSYEALIGSLKALLEPFEPQGPQGAHNRF